MTITNSYSLDEYLKNEIINKIVSYKAVGKIILFGSRASKTDKSTSDIDIAIISKQWTNKDINLVKDLLENKIKTPLKFDLLHFDNISKLSLKDDIIKEGKILYESKEN